MVCRNSHYSQAGACLALPQSCKLTEHSCVEVLCVVVVPQQLFMVREHKVHDCCRVWDVNVGTIPGSELNPDGWSVHERQEETLKKSGRQLLPLGYRISKEISLCLRNHGRDVWHTKGTSNCVHRKHDGMESKSAASSTRCFLMAAHLHVNDLTVNDIDVCLSLAQGRWHTGLVCQLCDNPLQLVLHQQQEGWHQPPVLQPVVVGVCATWPTHSTNLSFSPTHHHTEGL